MGQRSGRLQMLVQGRREEFESVLIAPDSAMGLSPSSKQHDQKEGTGRVSGEKWLGNLRAEEL